MDHALLLAQDSCGTWMVLSERLGPGMVRGTPQTLAGHDWCLFPIFPILLQESPHLERGWKIGTQGGRKPAEAKPDAHLLP